MLILFAAAIVLTLAAVPAVAQDATPVVTVTPDVDVAAGDVVEVTVEGMPAEPTNDITISTCFVFPVTGPNDCHLADFGEFVIETTDGAGVGEYTLPDLADRCSDASDPCQIVVSHGIGASAAAGGAPIVYAAAETPETTTTVADTTTTTEAPAETTTTSVAPADDEGSSSTTWIIIAIVAIAVIAGAVVLFLRSRA